MSVHSLLTKRAVSSVVLTVSVREWRLKGRMCSRTETPGWVLLSVLAVCSLGELWPTVRAQFQALTGECQFLFLGSVCDYE